ncbi:hypothetical protein [Stenotrophomonas sp.]|uniref:hypothetical protein n=1 Tax=Stenotrophomonas sp. TaxID=69392 RepID=UPI0028B1CADC|nr:hypothetical protein [Stenotrophomonas sp.]
MRNDDPMVQALRAWGHAQANRYALSHADRSVHVLDKARDFAPGTKERALRDLVGRDGTERRRFMARRSGVDAMHILPTWAVDPIRATNNADRPHDNPEIAVDVGIPDNLRWVESALVAMERQNLLRALIVRTEYTVAASQAVKARMVAEKYGGSLTLRQYRYELGRSLDLLRGRMAA